MNLEQTIKQKADELIRKATILPQIAIKWEKPILIKCNELTSLEKLKADKILEIFENNKKNPAIYFFKIVSKHSGNVIVDSLKIYKDLKKRSCPKIDKKRNMETTCLYCGSRKEGLQGRFIQHLGFGSQNTFALQLFHWASEIKLDLEFHYTWLKSDYIEFTELIESALTQNLKPLVGKMV